VVWEGRRREASPDPWDVSDMSESKVAASAIRR